MKPRKDKNRKNHWGRRFSGASDFQAYIRSSETCQNLMERMVEKGSQIIRRYSSDD